MELARTPEEMVAEFIRTTGASLDMRTWIKLIEEEEAELEEAMEEGDRHQVAKEQADLYYVTVGFNLVAAAPEQLNLIPEEEHKGLLFKLQKAGDIHEKATKFLGDHIDYFLVLKRVHENNMGRVLQPDGTIKRREDGKILKNPDYPKVILTDLIEEEKGAA